ncbi:hypothetical protein [Chishuiella changwenlii]|uniref:hypothetical protein n=1 Tax=Chishuiella changwenlii TaxID=1434701 RepID=UPI003A522C88
MNKFLSYFLLFIVLVGVKTNAQDIKPFKTPGTHDQYVPVVFEFKNKPFSISRPSIHEDREWLAYGTATISGIGFGWGSGNTKIKLENFTNGSKFSNRTGGTYSYIGNVSVEWISNGIIVYLRGNTTYYTDGDVKRNDGTYTAEAGPQTSLSAVSLDEKGFNIPPGVYVADWGITSETKSIENKIASSKEEIKKVNQASTFKTSGTHDQYVPVLFGFNNKPFSISRSNIHQDRDWLAYGTATISGIGYAWGSGNIKIKLENFTTGVKNGNNTGERYSYVGKVSAEWTSNGIIVYLRGNTTYYTDGDVKRNDGIYTAQAGAQTSLSAVSLDEKGYNIPPGIYTGDWEINAETKSIDGGLTSRWNNNIRENGTADSFKGGYTFAYATSGTPWNGSLISYGGFSNSYDTQLSSDYGPHGGNHISFRTRNGDNGTWNVWQELATKNSNIFNGNQSIEGKLEAKEIKVTETPTADFVFEEDYNLPTLQTVEKHIKEKKHLPEIASAKEMEKEGVNVGEFQIKLLQKIEELTLYIIEQNKVNEKQSEQLNQLIEEINQLKKN